MYDTHCGMEQWQLAGFIPLRSAVRIRLPLLPTKIVRKDKIMGLFGIKISGNKVTVKRPAPQSPANIRPVTPKQGNNPAHTHVNVPPSLVKKMTGGK